jgi:hypothetical protein
MSATNFNRLLGGVSFSSRSDQADLQLGEFNGNKVSTAVTRFSKMLRDASLAGLVKLRCGVKQKRQSPVMGCTGCFTQQVRLSLFHLQIGEVAWRRVRLTS